MFSYIDKREVLLQEYSQPSILPSPNFQWVVNRFSAVNCIQFPPPRVAGSCPGKSCMAACPPPTPLNAPCPSHGPCSTLTGRWSTRTCRGRRRSWERCTASTRMSASVTWSYASTAAPSPRTASCSPPAHSTSRGCSLTACQRPALRR